MKRLFSDQHAEETLKGSVIFAATFVVIGVILVAITGQTKYYNELSNDPNQDPVMDALGQWEYYFWNPTTGVQIASANVRDWAYGPAYDKGRMTEPTDTPGGSSAEFWKPGGDSEDRDRLRAYVVRDNDNFDNGSTYLDKTYEDYILFAQNLGSWWGPKWRFGAVSYTTIMQNYKDNVSATEFTCGKRNYTMFITVPEGAENYSDVYILANNYKIYIGQKVTDINTMGKPSMWAIIGKLMSFQLVDVNDPYNLVNIMITVPFYACIGFVVVEFVRRFIPFLGG